MYLPPAFKIDSPAEILAMLRHTPFGHLVTGSGNGGTGLVSTPLPFTVDDGLSMLRAHFARANGHWKEIEGAEALMIVPGVDAYISPRWYPSKGETGKVVPTWNYEVVHLHGTISIHDDPEWKLQLVSDLTDHNENQVRDPNSSEAWEVSDAPTNFVEGQLKAIVGVQLHITDVDAKQKLSQNRQTDDRIGATAGLARSDRPSDVATSSRMAEQR